MREQAVGRRQRAGRPGVVCVLCCAADLLRIGRTPLQAPDGRLSLDSDFLIPLFVSNGNVSIELSQRQVLSVIGPAHRQHLAADFELLHGLLLGAPQAEIALCGRRQLLRHGVVAEALYGVVVRVLENALALARPDDDGLVGAAGRETLAVARVSARVHIVLVTLQTVQKIPVVRVVDENAIAHRDQNLTQDDEAAAAAGGSSSSSSDGGSGGESSGDGEEEGEK